LITFLVAYETCSYVIEQTINPQPHRPQQKQQAHHRQRIKDVSANGHERIVGQAGLPDKAKFPAGPFALGLCALE